jgi:hypothetical protein
MLVQLGDIWVDPVSVSGFEIKIRLLGVSLYSVIVETNNRDRTCSVFASHDEAKLKRDEYAVIVNTALQHASYGGDIDQTEG